MEEIQHGDLTRAAEFWQMIHGREECHNAVAADRVEECHNVDEANALTEEDGWFKVSPYGEFPGKIPSLLQEAEAMLPEKIGNEAFDDEVTRLLTEAFLGVDQESEEVENAGNSDGAKKGWETRRNNGWVAAPKLITPQAADAKLSKGYFVKNAQGDRIRFGAELKQKLISVANPQDRENRKKRLRWAELAVQAGSQETTERHGDKRTIYTKTFRKSDKHQDVQVIVDTINGYAWNIMVKGGSADAIK